ncbi:FIST C-terminal domain-containing protein [Ruminococcaceae bacterium OttesenSCG-928-O06]|nr:FIST C-terminal domain-containing protein [Ruminococcaceae bacterium OttesenSCG-928-O06]
MIKTLVAYTGEIDDAQAAVEEVRAQLALPGSLQKNAVGIIACHYEFVLSGVAKAVCQALPFDVVGTITSAQAVQQESGTLLLTLMVLTSDDVRFVTKLSSSLLEAPGEKIAAAYREVAAAEAEKPALILPYAPFMVQNSGDEYVNVLTEASGGVPCFGTLAVDDTADFSNCFLLYNGQDYRDRLGMILLYGDLQPKFFIATISQGKILDKAALVTKSAGHILMEVNGRPVVEYFEDLGLTKASETSYAMTSLPFMLDYGDGTPPVSKVFIGLTPEKYAICAGAMPEGATLYIGVFDKEDVLTTTGEAADKALADIQDAGGLLIYSCISRNMSMGSDLLAELDLIRDKAGEKLPFMMAYSGGEICPTQVSGTQAINRFHNNAFVACVF